MAHDSSVTYPVPFALPLLHYLEWRKKKDGAFDIEDFARELAETPPDENPPDEKQGVDAKQWLERIQGMLSGTRPYYLLWGRRPALGVAPLAFALAKKLDRPVSKLFPIPSTENLDEHRDGYPAYWEGLKIPRTGKKASEAPPSRLLSNEPNNSARLAKVFPEGSLFQPRLFEILKEYRNLGAAADAILDQAESQKILKQRANSDKIDPVSEEKYKKRMRSVICGSFFSLLSTSRKLSTKDVSPKGNFWHLRVLAQMHGLPDNALVTPAGTVAGPIRGGGAGPRISAAQSACTL